MAGAAVAVTQSGARGRASRRRATLALVAPLAARSCWRSSELSRSTSDRRDRDRLRYRARVVLMWARSAAVLASGWADCGHAKRRPNILSATRPPSRRRRRGVVDRVRSATAEIRVPTTRRRNALSVAVRPTAASCHHQWVVLPWTESKLEAVLGPELAHIKRGDTVSGPSPCSLSTAETLYTTFAGIADRVAGHGREPLADLAAVAVTRYRRPDMCPREDRRPHPVGGPPASRVV